MWSKADDGIMVRLGAAEVDSGREREREEGEVGVLGEEGELGGEMVRICF